MDKRKDQLTFTVIYRDASTRPTGGNGKKAKRNMVWFCSFSYARRVIPNVTSSRWPPNDQKNTFPFPTLNLTFKRRPYTRAKTVRLALLILRPIPSSMPLALSRALSDPYLALSDPFLAQLGLSLPISDPSLALSNLSRALADLYTAD